MIGPLIRRAALGVSVAGLAFIAHYEGTRTTAYRDSVGVATICTGHTKYVRMGDRRTLGECEKFLREDASEAGAAVSRLVGVPMTQGQYDALVSFTFNLGAGSLERSTLLRKFNSGDCYGAVREFSRWNRADGVVMQGLVKRRAAEAALFKEGCDAQPNT